MRKSLYQCPAYWPRYNSRSTVDYNDRLLTSYCIWDTPESSVEERGINFVFVHGSQCCKEIFEFHAELLFQKLGNRVAKCIGIDVVTHGDSSLLNHNMLGAFAGWDDVARDVGLVVHDCINNRELTGSIVFIGHSMGGMCGLILSCFEPGLFDCIIPLDPIYVDRNGKGVGALLEGQLRLVDFASRTPDTFVNWKEYESFYRKRFCRTWDKRVVDTFVSAMAYELQDKSVKTKSNIANQMSAYLSSVPVADAHHSILKFQNVPTLILYGVTGGKLAASDPSLLTKVIGNGEAAGINGSHNFPFELPVETIDAMIPFINKHCGNIQWHRSKKNAEEATKWQMQQLKELLEWRRVYIKTNYFSTKLPSKF